MVKSSLYFCAVLVLLWLIPLSVRDSGGFEAAANPASSARDAKTEILDVNLTNSCVGSGQSKDSCVCTTRIFKYEMTLREYRAAVMLYAAQHSGEATALASTQLALRQMDYTPAEITAIENQYRRLIAPRSFAERCAQATTYFNDKS